jgi:hypothetical protein
MELIDLYSESKCKAKSSFDETNYSKRSLNLTCKCISTYKAAQATIERENPMAC